mmetsp:Transcript_11896/g.34862  ORF Transcript_11896/g.34862 Transcript_11896/m.34862 type:complete len:82 (-) Transcript_11896:578-823(-)
MLWVSLYPYHHHSCLISVSDSCNHKANTWHKMQGLQCTYVSQHSTEFATLIKLDNASLRTIIAAANKSTTDENGRDTRTAN